MNTTILQVPVKKDLRDQATEAAQSMGFSSLQDAVRIFLSKLASGRMDISFEETVVLSTKNARRYDKMVEDVKSGKVKTKSFHNVDSLMEDLTK